MRSITLHTVRRICIQQDIQAHINHNDPCENCPVIHICTMFYRSPINWSETDLDYIDIDSKAFYDMINGSNATK